MQKSRMRAAMVGLGLVLSMGVSLGAATKVNQRLPGGEVQQAVGIAAWLVDPVTRYDHGVLGDAVEAGGFQVQARGKLLTYLLGDDAVFEDLKVRLADVTGDKNPEAIVVKTYLKRGSALAAYSIGPKGITPLAESASIGKPHRWLNPIGIIKGKTPLIAAVIMPHLTGSLRLYKIVGNKLVETGRLDGFTNHIIGTRNLDLARIADVYDDGKSEIVIPDLSRTKLAVICIEDGKPALKKEIPAGGKITEVGHVHKGLAQVRLEGGNHVALNLDGKN